jgi:hypothetical protein
MVLTVWFLLVAGARFVATTHRRRQVAMAPA